MIGSRDRVSLSDRPTRLSVLDVRSAGGRVYMTFNALTRTYVCDEMKESSLCPAIKSSALADIVEKLYMTS